MKNLLTELWKLAIITIIGVAGSVTLGLMTHGLDVFGPGRADFAFVAFGASGAFILAIYHLRGLSNTITAAVSISAIQFVVATVWLVLPRAGSPPAGGGSDRRARSRRARA